MGLQNSVDGQSDVELWFDILIPSFFGLWFLALSLHHGVAG